MRRDLSAKQRVLGIEVDGVAKAYSLEDLQKQSGVLRDTFGDKPVEIVISQDGQVTEIRDTGGNRIAGIYSYWFAWQAFHPETKVYQPEKE